MIRETRDEGVEWMRDGAKMTARVMLGPHVSELSYVLGQETDMPLMTGGEVVKVCPIVCYFWVYCKILCMEYGQLCINTMQSMRIRSILTIHCTCYLQTTLVEEGNRLSYKAKPSNRPEFTVTMEVGKDYFLLVHFEINSLNKILFIYYEIDGYKY